MFMNKKCCCNVNPCNVNPCQNECMECCNMDPIMEKPIEKCVQKDIIHEVQHICPINTKVINNHIYKHIFIYLTQIGGVSVLSFEYFIKFNR